MALIAHWPLDGRLDDVIGNYPATIVNRSPNQANNETADYEVRVGGLFGEYLEKVGTASYRNIEFMNKEDFKKYFEKNRMISVHMFVKPVKNIQDIAIELIRNAGSFPHASGSGFWIDIRTNIVKIQTIYGEHNTGIDISKYLNNDETWLSVYMFLDFKQPNCMYTFIINTDVYTGSLKFDSVLSAEAYIGIGGYNPSTKGTGYSSIKLYDHKLTMGEIKEIMKCKILHFKFNHIEIPQYNSAESQTNIVARAGITISNKKQIKSWNFATISGTTTVGDSRKGVFQIPVTSSAPSENKYSIGVDFRLIGDDISNYYIQVVSNNMSGSPEYAPTRIEGDRFMFENMTIVNTFDLCLYAKVDDYRIPDNVQILWRHIQLEPYPNCTPYIESTAGSNYFHDSSDFRNKGTLGGMRFTPPIHSEENRSLTVTNNSGGNPINKISTDVKLDTLTLNQADFEITILCRLRTKSTVGYGGIVGAIYYTGVGICVFDGKYSVYCRCSSEPSGDNYNTIIRTNIDVNDNVFHNVAITVSRVTNLFTAYIDGLETSRLFSGVFSDNVSNKKLCILDNTYVQGAGPWLSGNIEISDVQVYRTALTKEEIDEAFSNKIELTPKGILKSKYTSNESNNLVDLNPPEYSPVPTASYAMYSLESSASNDLLVRASASDSYSRRFTLTKKIPANTKIFITFDTIRSDNITTDVDIEIICFTYIVGDQGVSTHSIHRISDPIVKTHTIEIIEGYDINFFRMDVNKQNATMLFRNIQIHTVGKNSCDVFNGELKLNQISYRKALPQTNLIDYTTWELNTKGPTGNFNQNGGVNDDNKRMVKLNPWNKFDIVWASEFNNPGSDADGGFNYSQIVNMDYTKKYRYSIWIRTENTGEGSGGVYFGPSNTGTEESTIIEFTDGRELLNTNPYWYGNRGLKLPKSDEWLLLIAYIYPESTTGTVTDDAGIYDVSGNLIQALTPKFKNSIMVTKAMMRSYLYYSTKVDERCYWYRPRIDLCDGTEPIIDDLLKGREHGSIVEALGKFNPTFPPDEQFLEIKRAHGVRWGKIFYHNNKAGTVLFSNDINEFLRCNTEDKKSILYALPYMRDKDYKFEFLLEYDSFEGYNRWKQTSIFTEENIAGYEAISISWDGNYWGGLEPNTIPTNSWVDGAVGSDNYRYALGARVNFNNAIPGPGISGSSVNMNETKGVHLWVRLPEVAFITPDNTLVVNDIECP